MKIAVLVCFFGVVALRVLVADSFPPVAALAFSPENNHLLLSRHRSVQVESLQAEGRSRIIASALPRIMDIDCSADQRWVAVAGGIPAEKGGVEIFTWPEMESINVDFCAQDVATGVAFHPDSSELALVTMDHSVRVFALNEHGTLTLRHQFQDHSGPVLSVAYHPDGRRLVTAGADRTLKVRDLKTGNLIATLHQHTGAVHDLDFRQGNALMKGDEIQCASAGEDGTVRIWQPVTGRMLRIIRNQQGPVLCVRYLPNGVHLLAAGRQGVVRMIDSDSDEVLYQWQAHSDWIYRMALNGDGTLLATGSWGGEFRIWELQGTTTKPWRRPAPTVAE